MIYMIKSKDWILALFTREHILKQVVEHSLISGVKENEIQNLF